MHGRTIDLAISTQRLTKRYRTLVAVESLDLEVGRGEVFGFLGPNGAGKTTTIRMLTGLLLPSSGTATVAGFDVVEQPLEVKRRVGYMAENPFLYEKLTGREFLRFVADLHSVDPTASRERAQRLLALFELADKADASIDSYSRGMRQKLALSASLMHEPEILFLDEPTSGMDPRSARTVKDMLTGLARRGRTVLVSTHILEIAQHMCDRVGIIANGRLLATGTLDELRGGRDASLEDIVLELTGGPEAEELAAFLGDG